MARDKRWQLKNNTFAYKMVKTLPQRERAENKPTHTRNKIAADDKKRHQEEKITALRNHLQLADTMIGAGIVEELLDDSDGNVVRAKMMIQKHVTVKKKLFPNKSTEKIILDYHKEKDSKTNGKNIVNTANSETERRSVPGSILYMRINYLQPKLQK